MALWNWLRPRSTTPRNARPNRLGLEKLEDRFVPSGSIPALHSNPGAPATIYLDFDGHFEATWGSYSNITTPVFDQDGDTTSSSDDEVAMIRSVWERVSEDFAPFNVNVTTVEPAVLAAGRPATDADGKALRVSIGGNSDWLGATWGGYAYIGSFTNSISNVCYVFDASRNRSDLSLANLVSHEAGHAFGLNHQSTFDANGTETAEYNPGNYEWTPLMGTTRFPTATSIWHNGTTSSAATFQDEMAILASATNGFGYRTDDHANTVTGATPLARSEGSWTGTGIVGTNSDIDYFSFVVTSAGSYRIDAAVSATYGNLDAVVELRNAAGQLITVSNPTNSTSAALSNDLTPGNYFVAVRSTGVYGRVGTYFLTVTAPLAGITVSAVSDVPTTGEDGRLTSLTVVLNTQPSANVVIPIATTDASEGSISIASLVFTPANWNVPQLVTVVGVADAVADGDVTYRIAVGPVESADLAYAGLDPADVSLTNADTDGSGFLYFAGDYSSLIRRSRPDGTQVETLIDLVATFGNGSYSPLGIAPDTAGGKLYWIDSSTDAIYRANLDGSAPERILSIGTGAAWGLVLDTAAGKMYWSDTVNKTIRRANLDGTFIEVVLGTSGSPYGLALDPLAGQVYWTEIAGTVSAVRRAALDGSNVETLWTGTGATTARAIALDSAAGKVYWLDRWNERIFRADLDGSGVEVVVAGRTLSSVSEINGFTLDVAAGLLYWQDFGTGKIYRSSLDGSEVVTLTTAENVIGLSAVHLAPGVSVSRATGLETIEGGTGTSFRIVLNTQPTAPVSIPVRSSDPTEGTVSIPSMTFTPANWYLPQTVTISSMDDTLADGTISYSIILDQTLSPDSSYHGLNPMDVWVASNDNDFNKFFVVDDASTNRTYRYGTAINSLTNSPLNTGNSAPRGAASTAAGDRVWVIDANKKVYIYHSSTGALLGSWGAGSLDKNAVVEGITVHGNDVWIVDARLDRVYRYANAANRTSGNVTATSSFALNSNNTSPKDLVTDGTHLWVVNDLILDKVFKYTLAGVLVGSWAIDAANASPTGITLDPSNPRHLWIVDNGSDRVYQYNDSVGRLGGSQTATNHFALAAGNTNPQGIADPPLTPWTEPALISPGTVMRMEPDTSTLSQSIPHLLTIAPSLSADQGVLSQTFTSSEEQSGNAQPSILDSRVSNVLSVWGERDSLTVSRPWHGSQDDFGRASDVNNWSRIHTLPDGTSMNENPSSPVADSDSLELFGCDLVRRGEIDDPWQAMDAFIDSISSEFFANLRRK